MSKKLTPWFPGNVKPARKGIYNASVAKDSDVWRHWDGRAWSYHWRTGDDKEQVAGAMYERLEHSYGGFWRGLAKEPK